MNPQLQQLMSQWLAQQPNAEQWAPLLQSLASPAEEQPQPDPGQLRRLKLRAQRQARIIASVADVLGACQRCIGLDPSCPLCAGHGHPGSHGGDPAVVRRWLAPVLVPERSGNQAVTSS